MQCRATLPPSVSTSEAGTRMAPYLWTLQFTHLFPQNCFVLDDGTGRTVGYVIGVPDVFAFAAAYPRYVAEVLQSERGLADVPVPKQLDRLEPWTVRDEATGVNVVNEECLAQTAYKVEWLALEGVEGRAQLVERYRAMLHIDILPEFQGQGWGRQMIATYIHGVQKVVAETKGEDGKPAYDYGRGVHLGVAGENTKVVPFYEKLGFRVYPGGEKEGNVWMVRDL